MKMEAKSRAGGHGSNGASAEQTENGTHAPATKTIWEILADISAEIPDEEWDKIPHDGSINYKHYLYGHPKVSAEELEAMRKAK
jgi:hypothetical protein